MALNVVKLRYSFSNDVTRVLFLILFYHKIKNCIQFNPQQIVDHKQDTIRIIKLHPNNHYNN